MALADYIGKYWAGAEVLDGVIIAMTFTSVLREYPACTGQRPPGRRIRSLLLLHRLGPGRRALLSLGAELHHTGEPDHRVLEVRREKESAVSLIGDQSDDSFLRNIPREDRVQILRPAHRVPGGLGQPREGVAGRSGHDILLGTFLRSTVAALVIVAPSS